MSAPTITTTPVDGATGLARNATFQVDVVASGNVQINAVTVYENAPGGLTFTPWAYSSSGPSTTTAARFASANVVTQAQHVHVDLTPSSPLWTPGTPIPLQVSVQWVDTVTLASGFENVDVTFTTAGTAPPAPARPIFDSVVPDRNATGQGTPYQTVVEVEVPYNEDVERSHLFSVVSAVDNVLFFQWYEASGLTVGADYTTTSTQANNANVFVHAVRNGGWSSPDPVPFEHHATTWRPAYPDLGGVTADYVGTFAQAGAYDPGGGSLGTTTGAWSPADDATVGANTPVTFSGTPPTNTEFYFVAFGRETFPGSFPPVYSWCDGIAVVDPDYVVTGTVTNAGFSLSLTRVGGWTPGTRVGYSTNAAWSDTAGLATGFGQTGGTAHFDVANPATIDLVAATPVDGAQDVSATTEVFVAVAYTPGATVDDFRVTVDGGLAYTEAGFERPEFDGVSRPLDGRRSVLVRPRRSFRRGASVPVRIQATLNGGETTFDRVLTFFVAPDRGGLIDPSLRTTRVDRAFPSPGLEVHRQALIASLSSRGDLSTRPDLSATVLLYYRVYASQLRPLAGILGVPPSVPAEIAGLHGDDLGTIEDADARLAAVRPLWEPALHELIGLGVPTTTVELLLRNGATGNAQERVAAASAAVLLAASRLP